MRRSVLFSFLVMTAAVVGGIHSTCRSSQPKPPGAAVSLLGSDSLDLSTLRALLGAPFQTTMTDHFLLLHEAGVAHTPKTGNILEHAYGQFYRVFTQAGFSLSVPQDRFVWICFQDQNGFNKYAWQAEGMDLSWLGGYYSTRTNRVAIVQAEENTPGRRKGGPRVGDGTRLALAGPGRHGEGVLPMPAEQHVDVAKLTHELAHQLAFNSGLQQRGVMYPLWASEGLATSFEFDLPGGGELTLSVAARRRGAVDAWSAGEMVPLREFVVQTQASPNVEVSRRHYAQAWAFFQYVLTEHPEGLRSYLRQMKNQPPGPRSTAALLAEFVAAFGPPESLDRSWNAFLAGQAQIPQETRTPPAGCPPRQS
jgi:hypothetical protein